MRHGSLFSGIGGFDLAAEWMGWQNVFHCEWEEFPRKVLAYHFPNAKSYGDIKETDFTIWRGQIDILSGGFPCQPFSQAGKRQGTEDDRYLWHEMLRAIQEISPRWIVGENVRGLVNWNGGMVFDQVCSDLEGEGYKVFPILIPAAAVNAPHRRDRIWFVAYFDRERTAKRFSNEWTTPDPYSDIRPKRGVHKERLEEAEGHISSRDSWGTGGAWENFPTQSPICGGDDGIPRKLDSIAFPKWRNESIKAYGNAIVPQVAYEIFKTIERYEILAHNHNQRQAFNDSRGHDLRADEPQVKKGLRDRD